MTDPIHPTYSFVEYSRRVDKSYGARLTYDDYLRKNTGTGPAGQFYQDEYHLTRDPEPEQCEDEWSYQRRAAGERKVHPKTKQRRRAANKAARKARKR